MWMLFDDARPDGAKPRLYAGPRSIVVAQRVNEVVAALEEVRRGLGAGLHAAGYLAYAAGHALDPALADSARDRGGPLVAFGLYDGFETPDLGALLPPPEG